MFDLHMHTLFSDGEHTPDEMVEEGISKGLTQIGISDHSHAKWDEVCMPSDRIEPYHEEIARIKEKYAGKAEVLCGLERDYYSDDFSAYDYVIGSVHAIRMQDGYYFCVDWMPERIEEDVRTYFGGDWYALTEKYFQMEMDVVRQTRCDIIGHFDLVCKYNEQRRWFDPDHPRYVAAWQKAADVLLKTGRPFEVNTGAISRGYRTDAYPAGDIRAYLKNHGGRLILSSDAHRKENIAYAFQRFQEEI